LLGVFPALLYDATTLSSGCCCEPNNPPGGAILVDFSGDPFVDIGCEQTGGSKQIVIAMGNFECSGVQWKIFKVAVTFSGMKASYIHLLCHVLVFHCTFDSMKPG
jgi:hypothetical protein